MTTTKVVSLVLAVIAAGILASGILYTSCSSSQGANTLSEPANTHTLVFIDKSLSIHTDSLAFKSQEKTLRQLIQKRISHKGDKLKGYFIHSNTGDEPFMYYECNLVCEDTTSGNERSKNEAKSKFEQGLVDDQILQSKELIKAWKEESAKRQVALATKIWPILEVMSDFFEKAAPGDSRDVFIFSDMIHADGKVSLYHLNSLADAEAAAHQHATVIRTSMKINKKNLQGVKVHIKFPAGALEASKNQVMKYYWEALFADFDMPKPEYL